MRWAACVGVMSVAFAIVGCAPIPEKAGKEEALVFPAPPDEPRFAYEWTLYSSADVIPEDKQAQMRRMVTGESSRGTPLTKPYAVAVHKGRMFLSDSVDRYVKAFDVREGKYFEIGQTEPGRLNMPLGLDVDAAGNLYVADITQKTIMVYDRDGKFLRKIGTEKDFERLSSVTVDRSGDRVYAVDIGGISSENHRVRVFDARSGAHLFDFGKRGTGNGEFNLPRDLAIGKDGKLYVVDGGNFRIQVFDSQGKYLQTFGVVGTRFGNFARPKEIAADRDGNLYVVDTAFGNFQIFNPEGELLLFVGSRAERDAPTKYMLPSGIFVDEDGRVYMVDQWFRKVDVYRPAALKPNQGFLARKASETNVR